MAETGTKSPARLPLIEAVIVVAVFAFISVALMRMYVAADRIERLAVNTSRATICAERLAEDVRSGAIEAVNGSTMIYYDSEWNEKQSGQEHGFTAEIKCETEQGAAAVLLQLDIEISNNADGTVLAKLETGLCRPNK